jgi:hypothetical protein
MTRTPSTDPRNPDARKLLRQLQLQTAAGRYFKLLQDNAARVIAKIVNS